MWFSVQLGNLRWNLHLWRLNCNDRKEIDSAGCASKRVIFTQAFSIDQILFGRRRGNPQPYEMHRNECAIWDYRGNLLSWRNQSFYFCDLRRTNKMFLPGRTNGGWRKSHDARVKSMQMKKATATVLLNAVHYAMNHEHDQSMTS